MPNVELIQKVLDHITAHPEEWNQNVWAFKRKEDDYMVRHGNLSCGTAYCFAGHAVQIAGYDIDWSMCEFSSASVTSGHSIPHTAQKELGLTDHQAMVLFSDRNNLADLYDLSNRFTDGAIDIPEEFK